MCVVMMLGAIAYVANQVGDDTVATLALMGAGAVLGFFFWNFPGGLIFLGDGGAYFLGFYAAELGILLLARNPGVSPLCPLLICIYPVFETLFTMYRRKVLRGRAMGLADGVHLHSLIYRRILRWAVGTHDAKMLTRRNSMTAPYLWLLCGLGIAPACSGGTTRHPGWCSSSCSASATSPCTARCCASRSRAGWCRAGDTRRPGAAAKRLRMAPRHGGIGHGAIIAR